MMKKGEIALSAVCLVFFAFMFNEALALRGVGRFGEVGSGFWPLLSLGIAAVLSLVWLVTNLRKYSREKGNGAEEPPEAVIAAWQRRRKIALCSVCLLAYIVVMPWIGFILSTLLFTLAFVLILGEKRKWVLIFSPLLITVVVVVLFAKFITIALPKGAGMFAEFSRFFY